MPLRPETLDTIAEEQGTYVLNLAFRDEDDEDVTPTSIKWSLTTVGGEVINDRMDVNVAVPAATVDVLLSGDDLQLRTRKESFSWRIFTVKARYNSSLGNNLPINKAVKFRVRNLRLVAQTIEISVYEGIFAGDFVQVSLA